MNRKTYQNKQLSRLEPATKMFRFLGRGIGCILVVWVWCSPGNCLLQDRELLSSINSGNMMANRRVQFLGTRSNRFRVYFGRIGRASISSHCGRC